jgi:hypothetical protein
MSALAVFSRVRLVRLCPARFACVALALVSTGTDRPVVQGDTGSCGSMQISRAEHWQNRAHAHVDSGTLPLAGAAALRVADLAWQGRPPPAAPDKRAPPATALLGGALAGSGPETSPCIDGLSLVSGVVVPQRLTSSNCAYDDGRPKKWHGKAMQASTNRPLACKARSGGFPICDGEERRRSERLWRGPWLSGSDRSGPL